jgi:hypothetical protein
VTKYKNVLLLRAEKELGIIQRRETFRAKVWHATLLENSTYDMKMLEPG